MHLGKSVEEIGMEKMSRKSTLKNILNGLLSSFVSRNNDVNGYWGIGKLYSLMINKQVHKVEIDLMNNTIIPYSTDFYFRISKYSELLYTLNPQQD